MEDPSKSSNNPPWIELLDSLIEVIIEKLPAADYIRFGIICKRWHSIQKEHRLRYFPKPPPAAPSVVLVNYKFYWSGLNWKNNKQLLCHLPFEQKKYRLFLPFSFPVVIIDSCCGWILTQRVSNPFSVHYLDMYNPVTGAMVHLPRFPYQYNVHYNSHLNPSRISKGCMSAPPTDPNCCIIITAGDNVFLLRLRDLVWEKVKVPLGLYSSSFGQFVYVKGKFYRIKRFMDMSFNVVDSSLLKSKVRNLEFDAEEMVEYGDFSGTFRNLSAIDGELFLVVFVRDEYIKKKFGVFRANFTTKKWIKVTYIGDYAILLCDSYAGKAVSLSVNSFEGFKKNMIYFTQKFEVDNCVDHQGIMWFRVAWMTFDMNSQEITEGPSFLYDKDEYNEGGVFMLFCFFPTF